MLRIILVKLLLTLVILVGVEVCTLLPVELVEQGDADEDDGYWEPRILRSNSIYKTELGLREIRHFEVIHKQSILAFT